MCTGSTTDGMWVNTKVCSVTSKPRAVADGFRPFKDSSTLLNIKHTACGESLPVKC